ncbi:MAG: methyltransferase domain-containing protein [Gammaproteobacteria bacterium]|jgi:predicted methyltransferase|nr:methyltransferase domain-containing protein [Gammaproteobacteria bacterium]
MKSLISFVAVVFLCTSTYSQEKATLDQAMTNPYRPASDKARDSIRKAPEILQFMGVKQADTALDLIAMGGWYTEVLSYAVGPSGKVYMQNNPIPITERSTDERTERISRLSNVEDYVGPIANLTPNSVDFVMTALNFHDVYNRSATDADQMLKEILGILKPGGILSIIDHQGTEGSDNATLHRITFRNAVKASVAAGFVLVGTSDILENPNDDHTLTPFDPSLERRTDRFVLKLAKPM